MAYVAMTSTEENENLRNTVAILNDKSPRLMDWRDKSWGYEDAVRLRRLVRTWDEAGRDPMKTRLRLEPRDLERLENHMKRIQHTTAANGMLLVFDYFNGGDAAAMHFTRLWRNSQNWRLRGPCLNVNCGAWYIAKTNRENRGYCSRQCAGNAVQARARKRESDRKIKKARAALRNYPDRPKRFAEMGWKDYVSKATGISKRFLTEAERSGELIAPFTVN